MTRSRQIRIQKIMGRNIFIIPVKIEYFVEGRIAFIKYSGWEIVWNRALHHITIKNETYSKKNIDMIKQDLEKDIQEIEESILLEKRNQLIINNFRLKERILI